MAEEVDEIRIAGTFSVFAAPEGTVVADEVPADRDAYDLDNGLDAAFIEVGFTSPDGSKFTDSKTVVKIPVHQRFRAPRTIVTERSTMADFVMRQFNADNVPLAFGGGAVTEPTAGTYKYTPPAVEDLDYRVYVLDTIDGDIIYRYVIKRGMVSSNTETQMSRTAASDLPITIEADEPTEGQAWYLLSNDPAMAPTGS